MIVYIVMLILSMLFAYLSIKSENKIQKALCMVLTMLPFIIVAGFRYDVGTDYSFRYVPDFNKIANGIDVGNLEVGFKIIIKGCLLISNNSQLLFIVTSVMITFFIIYGIKKASKNMLISILLFVIGGFFFQSLNLVRQFLAMAIVFFAYQYLLKKNKLKWYVIAVIIAAFIHSSSIIMIGLIFCRKKLLFNPWITLSITCVILLFGNTILELMKPAIEATRFNVYLVGRYAKGDTSMLYNMVNLLLYIFVVILYKYKIKNQKSNAICSSEEIYLEDKLLINIQALALIFTVMSSMHMLFSRIAYYFMIFQLLSIPYFIETTVNEISMIKLVHLKMKNNKIILYGLIIISFLSLTFYTNILNNDNEPLPYRSIFDKERKIE